jgi:hypothetical protein
MDKDDLVSQLRRKQHKAYQWVVPFDAPINPDGPEAADEIERLRASLESSQSELLEALSYGTLSMTKRMVVIDFDSRERAEAMYALLERTSRHG